MKELIVGILLLFIVIAIRFLRSLLTEREEKQDGPSRRWSPQRGRYKLPEKKATRLPQAPSPIQPEIREKGEPYFSKGPPRIPKSVPDPFDYQAEWWKKYSTWYRNERGWTCEICQISLNDNRYYLHTHHIWGTQYNDPQDLMALCIACHSEQPGGYHSQLKERQDYDGFMKRYGKQWRFRRYD